MNRLQLFRKSAPRWVIFVADLGIVLFAIVASYALRFNFQLPENEIPLIPYALAAILLIRAINFYIAKTYIGIIRYTSFDDAKKIIKSVLVGSVFIALSDFVSYQLMDVFIIPSSVVIIEFLLTTFIMITSRAFIKLIYNEQQNKDAEKTPVLIFGAGEAGVIAKRTIDRDLNSNFLVVGFADDDPQKTRRKLENKPIYPAKKLKQLFLENDISNLIISTQHLSKERLQELIKLCFDANVNVMNVPSASKWINGELSVKQIRQIRIEDLLGREPIKLSVEKIKSQTSGKVILISGAAGSIGSEIVRQLCRFKPKKLILLDQAESALYDLSFEFTTLAKGLELEIVVGDVSNIFRMEQIFSVFKPNLVFHAAAYKHVPLMEDNPYEAVHTNVAGTKILADLSNKYKVGKFVMISTDKAVNPTNIMGASKRVAEIYVQALDKNSDTKFITTRFGNVLGSNGSVIPLFKKQIDSGGPITVTHPEISRYFMTIPEACQLVLEAGASGNGGEIYIFDMGKSIKIKDLASQMIRLSGLEEGKDIQVVYSGLRPGEKLYEELLNDQENTLKTHHPQIMIAKVTEYDYSTVNKSIESLVSESTDQSNEKLVALMKSLVPEFKSNNSVYEALDIS